MNLFCDSFADSRMFMRSWNDTDSQPGDLHPISAYRQQMMQGQYPTQQQRVENFNWHVNNFRNMRNEWNATARGQGSQSRDNPNGRPERRHLQGAIHFGTHGMQSNAGSSQLKDGMIARFDHSNQNIGSEAGNVTRMRSQYPSCQYMEDSQLPAVRTYPSANPYAGSSAIPSNQRDQYNYGFTELTRRRIMASSCEFAAPAWDDGSSHNHDIPSMNNSSQHHQSKNIPSSNPHSWNWTHTGSSSEMSMNAGQQKHGMDQRHGSTSAGSGFPSTHHSTNRSSCEFDKSSQLQQPSYQKHLPVDKFRPMFPVAEAEPNERASNKMKSINNHQSDGVNIWELSCDDWVKYILDKADEYDLHRSQLESPPQNPSMIPDAAVSGMPSSKDQQSQAINPRYRQSNSDSASTPAWDGASTSCSIQLQPDLSKVEVNQGGSSMQLPNSKCLVRESQSSSDLPGIDSTQPLLSQQSTLPQQTPVIPDPSTDSVSAVQRGNRPKTSCGKLYL